MRNRQSLAHAADHSSTGGSVPRYSTLGTAGAGGGGGNTTVQTASGVGHGGGGGLGSGSKEGEGRRDAHVQLKGLFHKFQWPKQRVTEMVMNRLLGSPIPQYPSSPPVPDDSEH